MPDSELGTPDTQNAQGTKQTNSCFTGLRHAIKSKTVGKKQKRKENQDNVRE